MKIPDLTLPVSGGAVCFRDDDDLTGWDYRRLRGVYDTDGTEGETRNLIYTAGAAVLVASWDIPGLPGLPLPTIAQDGKTVDPGGLSGLKWRDLQAIEKAVAPFVREILFGIVRPVEAGIDPKE